MRFLAVATILWIASSTTCLASLIAWDSFSSGNGFRGNSFEGAFSDFWYAMEFQSSESGNVALVEVPLSFRERRTDSIDVTLGIYTASGSALGTFLGSSTKSIDVPSGLDDTVGRVFEFNDWNSSVLAGSSYWMVLSAQQSTVQVNWHTNSIFPSTIATGGTEYRSDDGGATWSGPRTPASALRVTLGDANAIPEPTTLALISLGIAGLGFRRKIK